MKRFLLLVILSALYFIVNAAPKTWVGGSGNWSDGAHWSPAGMPVNGDDITINAGGTFIITIDVAGPFLLNSLLISNSTAVTFNCPGTCNFTLSSTSPAMPGLQIDAGCVLTLDGSNVGTNNSTLFLSGGAGVIGTINGTLIFSSSGGPRAGASIHLDTNTGASNYGIVTVNSGGQIQIYADAGNTQTSVTPVPNIIMKNGSVYQTSRNGGSFPVGTWETTSLAKATSIGANAPTFNGTTYGNLEWDCPAQTAITFLSSDVSFNNVNFISTNNTAFRIRTGASAGVYTMTVNGNLDVSPTSVIEITSNTVVAPNGGKLHLLGSLSNAGTIKTTGAINTVNEFELNGTSNQNITNTGIISGGISGTTAGLTLIMNNAAGATLQTPVTIPANLTLTSGKIKTTSTNILSMSDNAPSPAGSSTSFVEGPMKKGGNDNTFTFPVGVGSIYAPVGFNYTTSLTLSDTIRAEYIRGNPQTTYGTIYDPTNNPYHIDHTSFVEYWKLRKTTGSAGTSREVTIPVTQHSFCRIFDDTFVASFHPSSSTWQSCANTSRFFGGTVGGYDFGTITIAAITLVDSVFTLATNDPFSSNPLPIDLISFDASKLSTTKSTINWELAACCSSAAKFEIQRAGTDKHFVTIGTVGGSETNKLYNYIDNGLKNGINYYRLKMIDADGKISYSRTVAVMNGVNGLVLTSLIPTVVTNTSALTVASSDQNKLDIVIVDMQGRVVLKRNFTIAAGNTNIGLQLNGLAAGVYQLTGISAEGKTNTIRFIKQ